MLAEEEAAAEQEGLPTEEELLPAHAASANALGCRFAPRVFVMKWGAETPTQPDAQGCLPAIVDVNKEPMCIC